MSEVAGNMGDAGAGDVASQEDFRAFVAEEAAEWGDANDEGVLDGLEVVEEEAPDAPVSQARREGTDEVLARLRTSDPEAARIMSGMQRQMHQNINEWNQLKGEVLGLREQMLNQREEGQAPQGQDENQAEQPGLPDGVSDEHLEMFRAMADHLGYLPRQELQERVQRQASRANIQQNLVDAYEQFGDQFGERDENGNINIHPEVQERLRNRLAQLQDPANGITPLDLYKLEFGAQAPVQQQRQGQPQRQQTQRPSPSATVRRSSRGGNPRVRIYNPERNDSAEDVFERAWALGKRQLTGQ
tara:strand:+ start:859 stop:1761 length:903 start_codon:yes stop_codon:yes gene_type:complete